MDTQRPGTSQADRHIEASDLDPNPFNQFREWFDEAVNTGMRDANAMILATSTQDGDPSARTVLLKGFDEHGFKFFTNYESRKGRALAENPRAALVFYWRDLNRQIRITGTVERVGHEESFAYFRTRARGSRIGAWASRQSEPLDTRQELIERVNELEQRYADAEIPLPPHWGGYRVVPDTFEFWESRENRLHDRFQYTRQSDDTWAIQRLQP